MWIPRPFYHSPSFLLRHSRLDRAYRKVGLRPLLSVAVGLTGARYEGKAVIGKERVVGWSRLGAAGENSTRE